MRSGPHRAWFAALALALLVSVAAAQQAPQLGRTIDGVVTNALNQPLGSAIVYLKNMRTKDIRNVITGTQGTYAFHQLQPGVTYEVYAAWQGHSSKVRTASQYLSQTTVRLDLKIPVG